MFNIDIEKCPFCEKGKLKVIASIEEARVIKQILEPIGVDANIPRPHAARAPPEEEERIFRSFRKKLYKKKFT